MKTIRVMLVEDHLIVAEGLKSLLAGAAGVQVVALMRDAESALEWLSHNECDVLLLDISLPGRDGFWLLETLASRQILVATLVLTMHKDNAVILKAMDLGAAGYLVKSVDADELARAIAAVAAGSSYGDRYVKEAVAMQRKGERPRPDAVTFSSRERQILVMLAEGASNLDLAVAFDVSKRTIKTQIHGLYQKIGAEDRTQATLYAIRHGFVSMPADPNPTPQVDV